ncbi:LysR substrate binding domain protein [compost metagenome]
MLGQDRLQLTDLARYALAGTQLPVEVARAIGELAGNEKPLAIECDNFMVLKAVVAGSDVLSMAPWDVVAEDIQAGRLALLQIPAGTETSSAYGVVSHAARSLSPAARAVRELLLEEDRDFSAV